MARKYYYDTGDNKVGPVDGEELLRLRSTGALPADTWVREEDSATWRPLSATDLTREEREAANPGIWKLLLRHVPLPSLILAVAVFVVVVAMLVFFIGAFWPLLLAFGLVWMLMNALRRL